MELDKFDTKVDQGENEYSDITVNITKYYHLFKLLVLKCFIDFARAKVKCHNTQVTFYYEHVT